MMNLYKAGEIDAVYNHVVPMAWFDRIKELDDYMNAPEAANEYYLFNTARGPMTDVKVRRAFNMAIDKVALAEFRRVAKPLTAFVPEGIFPGYPSPRGDPFDVTRARALLAEAGYTRRQRRVRSIALSRQRRGVDVQHRSKATVRSPSSCRRNGGRTWDSRCP